MIEGIILSGGYSARTGVNKMILSYRKKPLIWHVVETMRKHVDAIVVVTGHFHEDIVASLKSFDHVQCIRNEAYRQGMFSSVQKGVAHARGDMMIVPGDYPLIQSSTYQKLLKGHKSLRVPSIHQRLGHPIFIKSTLRDALLKEPAESNLKSFRDKHDFEVIDVDDEGILMDIDTLSDYVALKTKEERNDFDEN